MRPAHYNNDGSNFSKDNVGELWNTGVMRVRWYEQAGVDYRADYWVHVTVQDLKYMNGLKAKTYSEYLKVFNVDRYQVDPVFNKKTNTYPNTYYYCKKIDTVPPLAEHQQGK